MKGDLLKTNYIYTVKIIWIKIKSFSSVKTSLQRQRCQSLPCPALVLRCELVRAGRSPVNRGCYSLAQRSTRLIVYALKLTRERHPVNLVDLLLLAYFSFKPDNDHLCF